MSLKLPPFHQLLANAKAGNPNCFQALASCYAKGEGVATDEEQALFWYKKAWKYQHDSQIALMIARLYFAQHNTRNALYWLEKAVNLNDAVATLEYIQYLMSRKKIKSDVLLWQLLIKVIGSSEVNNQQIIQTSNLIKKLSMI